MAWRLQNLKCIGNAQNALTFTHRSTLNSQVSQRLRQKRKYNHTQRLTMSAGKRYPR